MRRFIVRAYVGVAAGVVLGIGGLAGASAAAPAPQALQAVRVSSAGMAAEGLATADSASAGLPAGGTLYAWGDNQHGELGDGTTTQRDSPEAITLAPGVTPTAVAAGAGYDSLAIGSNGGLYAWGWNIAGQLGDGTTTDRDSPEAITLAAGVTPTAIAAGYYHSLAIGSDGNLYAWGWNGAGQLGDGTTTEHNSPEAITLAAGVTPTAIATGDYHSLAIGSDGNLYAWGDNQYGELGDGTTTDRYSPEAITLAAGVTPTAIAAGYDFSLAIGSDGNLYAWGVNIDGELGDGTTTDRDTPEAITLSAGVTATAIAAGNSDSLAIGSDGKLYAWGYNGNGEVGDGTTTQRDSPEAITLAAGVTPTAVAAGGGHSLAIGSDGKFYAWGFNKYGELGDGTTTQRDRPEAITLAHGVTPTAIAAGFLHSLAIGCTQDYNTPADWDTALQSPPLTEIRPYVEPLNVIISACSNVSLSDIEAALGDWSTVYPKTSIDLKHFRIYCISPEKANVTGQGYVTEDEAWRLDGCVQGNADSLFGAENHVRIWNQPVPGSKYGAWLITASYETMCVGVNGNLEPFRAPDGTYHLDPPLYHCVDGGPGSYDLNGYNRGARDFAAEIVKAAQRRGWLVTEQIISRPLTGGQGTGEDGVTFNGKVYVLRVTK
jgi:alpha-tubulin suppressor-like RCC1 family protein